MQKLPAGGVSAIISDPPYGMDYQSSRRTGSERFAKIANDTKPYIWWLPEAFRILKERSAMYCFCDWRNSETFRIAIETAGFTIKSQAVWDRESHGMGDLKGSLSPRHDIIWFATKGRFEFPGKRPASVFRSMRITGTKLVHPNEKPIDLMTQMVESITSEGEKVIDPFMGSGSTGVAAINTGRAFVGIERDTDYFAMAQKRIEIANQTKLDDLSPNIATDLFI
jgi:site-specific DNA-methyltransferase (adenine-specific)